MAQFFPRLTVSETIRLFGSFYPKRKPEKEILNLVGLTEKAHTPVEKLSGGQLKRLSVGLALVGETEVVFFDEPTSGLDPQSRRGLWDIILALKNEGRIVFLTTHYLDEAKRLCDRVVIIDHGAIIALGKSRELIAEYFREKAVEIPFAEVRNVLLLSSLPSVMKVRTDREIVTLYTQDLAQTFAGLSQLEKEGRLSLHDVVVREATLEDVFLKLTREEDSRLRVFSALFVAHFKNIYRDRMSIFWFLALPVLFVFLFGVIFGGIGKDSSLVVSVIRDRICLLWMNFFFL